MEVDLRSLKGTMRLDQLTCASTDSLHGFGIELAAAGFVGRFQLLLGGIQQLADARLIHGLLREGVVQLGIA
jgi:hypothetical protein